MVHGLTSSKLADKPHFDRSHAETIMNYLGKCHRIIGHNTKFDIARLCEQFGRVGATDLASQLIK